MKTLKILLGVAAIVILVLLVALICLFIGTAPAQVVVLYDELTVSPKTATIDS